MKHQIKNRFTQAVMFEFEAPEDMSSGMLMRHTLEQATKQRPRIDLSGADLRGADLRDADLRGADLRDADLRDADLSGAYLSGAYGEPLPRATPEQAVENLDKVRAIIMDDKKRLDMAVWHQDEEWKGRTCAEETLCGTAHCLAGWLQVCTTEPKLKEVSAELAGIMAAPMAAKMFFRQPDEVMTWLENREYAK